MAQRPTCNEVSNDIGMKPGLLHSRLTGVWSAAHTQMHWIIASQLSQDASASSIPNTHAHNAYAPTTMICNKALQGYLNFLLITSIISPKFSFTATGGFACVCANPSISFE